MVVLGKCLLKPSIQVSCAVIRIERHHVRSLNVALPRLTAAISSPPLFGRTQTKISLIDSCSMPSSHRCQDVLGSRVCMHVTRVTTHHGLKSRCSRVSISEVYSFLSSDVFKSQFLAGDLVIPQICIKPLQHFDRWRTFHHVGLTPSITPMFNRLNPTGHVMHQHFNIQQLYVLPTLYLCVLYLSENKQRLVPLTP